jgi:Flp pilus assembly protein TadG
MAFRIVLSLLAGMFRRPHMADRRGTVAVAVALSMPALIGFAGFAVDVSMWYTQHISLQTAADAAAIKAASDLNFNPAITHAQLVSDALAAANAALNHQITLSSSAIAIPALTAGQRQVSVTLTIPAQKFFTNVQPFSYLSNSISTSSSAGIGYKNISTRATCYSVDSFTYLYSTGVGTVDTAHSSGIDPYQCNNPQSAPRAADSFCGGGVLGCNLNILDLGGILLPFAIQLGSSGTAGSINVATAPAINTLTALLSAATGPGSMTTVGPGTPYCTGTPPSSVTCTVPAGVYNGGLTIQPNVTVNFTAGAGGSNYFVIENGNLVMSTQATLGTVSPNNVFYFGGSTPGAFVEATQVMLNTAPIDNGSITLTSTSTFSSSSIVGTQTSAPLSAMADAQTQAAHNGLIAAVGSGTVLGSAPMQNLVGTNFESEIATCPQATATCAATQPGSNSTIFQYTLLPSLGIVSSLGLNFSALNALTKEGETSSTVITSGVTFKNGVATDWRQEETANSSLTNILGAVRSLLGPLQLLSLLSPIANSQTNSQDTGAYAGVFPGQTSTGAPSCATGNLYSNTITPNFSPGYSDILDSSGDNGTVGAVTTQDVINICGTSETNAVNLIGAGTQLANSLAASASTVVLLQ